MGKREFHVEAGSGRLDHYLVKMLPDFSRSRIQQLIKKELVEVNGKTITKTGFALEGSETVIINIPAPKTVELEPEAIDLDVLFQNEDVIVINKPAGMVVHPSVGHETGTLVHAVLAHDPDLPGIGGEIRPGVVHRLDKNTSGIIIFARNDAAMQHLQAQFKERKVKKIYLALCDGKPPTPKGRVETTIGRDPGHRKKMAVVPPNRGRMAISIYHTIETFKTHTYMEVEILTGRTHQIRVHLGFLKCPVAGDGVYGRQKRTIPLKKRHFLHAHRLILTLPGEDIPRTFEAPLPAGLAHVLEWLRVHDAE